MCKNSGILTPQTRIGKIRFAIEAWFYRHGVSNANFRKLLAVQVMVVAVMLFVGVALAWHTQWVLWIGIGGALGLVNFYFMGQKIQFLLAGAAQKGSTGKIFLNFYLRLFVTATFLFVFIVWLKASIPALLIGLSLSGVASIIFGLTQLRTLKAKEASDNA